MLSLPNATEQFNLTPQRKRETLFDAFIHQLEAIVRRGPVLMIFEDAHWIDPDDARAARDHRRPGQPDASLACHHFFRPEFRPPWTDQPNATVLALSRLGANDGTMLVQDLAGHVALEPDVIAEIVERTDGVPLFIEELTKAVLESGEHGNRAAATLAASPRQRGLYRRPCTLRCSLASTGLVRPPKKSHRSAPCLVANSPMS